MIRRGDLKECQNRCSGLAEAEGWVGSLERLRRWSGADMVGDEAGGRGAVGLEWRVFEAVELHLGGISGIFEAVSAKISCYVSGFINYPELNLFNIISLNWPATDNILKSLFYWAFTR